MKKAKRLLAVIMAAIMIASAACIPAYARTGGVDSDCDYTTYTYDGVKKFYFTAEQGATYVLDMIDQLLAEQNIALKWKEDPLNLPGAATWALNLTKINGDDKVRGGGLILTSIDALIMSLHDTLVCLDEGAVATVAGEWLSLLGELYDIAYTHEYLDDTILRGTAPKYQDGHSDLDVLYNVLNWLNHLDSLLGHLAAGTLDSGILADVLDDDIGQLLEHFPDWLKNLLYTTLIDSEGTKPSGYTVDMMLQQIVDWALIDGTGETAASGANSVLGENFEAFLPAVGDQPGGAGIGSAQIQADRNGDGVPETVTMNFYQLVNNAIQGLLNGMLKELLQGVLFDALDVDPSDGLGDPDVMTDVLFNTILGAVEGLCVQNGAPAIVYSDLGKQYPVPKINDLLDWFFAQGGGLATLISFDYNGIHIQDNLMSLLNDVARLAPGLMGALGIEVPEGLAYSPEELNAVYYFNSNHELCLADDPDKVDVAYLSYEKDSNGQPYSIYVSEYQTINDVRTPKTYAYLSNSAPVNTTDASKADYINPTFIRENYVLSTSQVWACLLKILLNSFIDGCYFPDWADSISSVGAYALASMAAVILPEENFFERLDRYHYEVELGETYTFINENKQYDALPYTITKTDPTNPSNTTVIPKAALDIGAAIGAFYLNGVFAFDKKLTVHNTTLEQFAFEFLVWGFTYYLPILAGNYNTNTGLFEGGTYTTAVNKMINSVYSNPVTKTERANVSYDGIYELLDNTLFALLPSDWLPARFGDSFMFVNDWLLNSVVDFDIQKLISLLSVNPNGELAGSVTQVLLNIVARVLGTVFGGTPIMPIDNANNLYTSHPTTVHSFEELVSGSSLSTLLVNLIHNLYNQRRGLCETIFPLLLSVAFVPDYDPAYLGTDKTSQKITDLETYIDYFTKDVNASVQYGDVPFNKLEQAQNAASAAGLASSAVSQKANATTGKTEYVVTFPYSYSTERSASAASLYFDGGYVSSNTVNGTTSYYVYAKDTYLDSATRSADLTDEAGTYHTYSGFKYATLSSSRTVQQPLVSYEDAYRFFEPEDFRNGVFYYNNYEDAIEDAERFISDYNSYATSTLPAAYADWSKFMINARLYAAGLYDANDDGIISRDGDGNLTEGKPSIPDSDYPYYTVTSGNWSYYDKAHQGIIGRNTTVNMNEFNAGNYEVYALALAYGNDSANDVTLPDNQAEAIVRLYLGSINFDITAADGSDAGDAAQWATVNISGLSTFCANNGYTLVDDGDGTYSITRKAFAPITDSMTFGVAGTAVRPQVTTDDDNYGQEINSQICESYDAYVEQMSNLRNNLYNYMDFLSFRVEQAEGARSSAVDISSLNWALKYTESAYIDAQSRLRNQKIVGATNGQLNYGKIYTKTSYDAFQDAYDFARSVADAALSSGAATGLTQSLVSAAYMGLIDAFKALKLFSDEANWAVLESYIELANSLVNVDDPTDPVSGYTTDSFQSLLDELAYAVDMRNNSGYDSEQNDIISAEATDLYDKINELVFNSVPDFIAADGSSVKLETTSETGAFCTRGHIYNLEEGVGLTKDMIKCIGMVIDPEHSKNYYVSEGDFGFGTGALAYAEIGKSTRVQYWAVLFGDLNGDTRIDGTDKSMLDYYILKGDNNVTGMGDDAHYEAGDVNHDGQVDQIDANIIEGYYNYTSDIDQSGYSLY